MKVILKEDHDTLGDKGDIVTVKDGYGRNFLIPRQLAVVATKSSVKQYEEERRQAAHKIAAQRQSLEALAARMTGTEVVVTARTGEDNRLFGTITGQQVVDALAEKGFTVDRRKLTLGDIRTTGTFPASVRLASELAAEIQVTVVPEGGAANEVAADAEMEA